MPGLPGGAYPGQVLFPLAPSSTGLTRVQGTGRVSGGFAPSLALTFATPPTVGNGIVVLVSADPTGTFLTSCADNRGHTYTKAKELTSGALEAVIHVCPVITTSAAPFTITVSFASGQSGYFEAAAIEVSGVGTGLAVDQTASGHTAITAVSTGTTPALTASEVLLAAVATLGANQSAITVQTVSPAWTEEYENLNYSATVAGEGDTRIITGAAGTTQSCSWTAGTAALNPAVLVAFKAGAPTSVALAASASITVSTTAALGLLTTPLAASASLRISATATLDILGPLRVTQSAAEVFGLAGPVIARVTQTVLEVFGRAPDITFTRDPIIGLTWVEFTDALGETHVWSDVALPDPISYYFGFKDNRVTQWGTIRRSLSDDQGQYVGSDLSWTVSDADHAIRALLADPATRAIANRPVVVRMISDPGRRGLERPRDVYFGIVRDYQPASPLTFQFGARDYFDAIFNPTGDQRFPRRVITLDDFPMANDHLTVGATEVPIGALNLPVPIIYGRITDQLLIDGADQGDGQCPAILVGQETLSDGRDYYMFLVAGHACQGIDEIYVGNYPQLLATDPAIGGSGGFWKVPGHAGWTDEFATPYRDINGHRYTLVYGKRGPETPIVASAAGGPAVIEVADTSIFVDGVDAIFANHLDASPPIDGVHAITIVDATHVSIALTLTAGGTGGTMRQAFGPDIAAGAAPSQGLTVPFALDVRGIETNGNGTGSLIIDGPLQYLHCLLNWIIGDYQTGPWSSTPPLFPDATHLPLIDVASFQRANTIAKARISGGYRGDFIIGYTGMAANQSRIGGERLTARGFLARFNASFDMDVGFNRHSQFMASMIDDSPAGLLARARAPLFVGEIDVLKDSLTITDDVPQLFNRIPWRDTEDYFNRMSEAAAKPLTKDLSDTNWRSLNSGVSFIDDADSIADYSTNPAILTPLTAPLRKLYMVRSKARDIDSDVYLQGTATRDDVIARYLARHRDPPRSARLTIGLPGYNLDLGEIFRLTHFAGVGAAGWVERRLRIVAHDADLRQQTVTLTAQDMGST